MPLMRSLTSGAAIALNTEALSRWTMALGVAAGTTTPYHSITLDSSGRPASCAVGTSGSAGLRLVSMTPSARSLPLFTCGTVEVGLENISITWPPSRSLIAGPAPLYGTCTRSVPVACLNSSPTIWGPAEVEAKVSLPGFWRAYCASSRRSFTGTEGCATAMNAISVVRATAAKSRSVS
jgi:hypothetical protein